MSFKIAFFGTPKISTYALNSFLENNIEVVVVVTNEDQPIGRNHSSLQESEVATLAKKNNIPIIKTSSINKDIEELKKYEYDFLITCAFGQFLSDDVLATPNIKSLNLHASLLPEGRGGAPIHWSIINRKKETGLTLMEMINEMDAGNIYSQSKIELEDDETYDSLYGKFCKLLNDFSYKSVEQVYSGKKSIPQDNSKVSKWLNITKESSKINWSKPIEEIESLVRGLYSKPMAWTTFDYLNIKITKVEIPPIMLAVPMKVFNPGEIVKVDKSGILVSNGQGYIFIKKLIMPGKQEMSVEQLINGNHIFEFGKFFV